MKSCFFILFVVLSIAVASDLKVFCVDRSSYKVGICVDSKCEKSVTPLEVCHKEGQSIHFDVEGQSKNVICKNPQVVCQDSVIANRTLFEEHMRKIGDENVDGSDETDSTEVENKTPTPTTPTVKPTTIPPTTPPVPTVGLPDEPIVIPEDVDGVITENNKKVIQSKIDEQEKLTKEEIKTQTIAERQAAILINSKPYATEETTKKFMDKLNSTYNSDKEEIVFTTTEAVDMQDYSKTDLTDKTVDGNNQEIILQFNTRKSSSSSGNKNRELAAGTTAAEDATTYEDDENIISLQMFSEVNNTVIKNMRISVIVKGLNNNNNNLEVRECGIFGKLNNVTLQNIVVIFYNPITFNCLSNKDGYAGILVNEATNSEINRVKIEFARFGNGLLNLNTTDKNIGILVGKAENITIKDTHIIGDSLVAYGNNANLYVGGMIGELTGVDNKIESSTVDVYFLSLYKEVNYGGLIGKSDGVVKMDKISNYIRRGLTIGVNTGTAGPFSFGGLISEVVDGSVSVVDSWVSFKTYGVEANSTETYFGGFIGNANDKTIEIERSYVRIYTGHKRFLLVSSDNTNEKVKIGYYFGDFTLDTGNKNLKLNETSAYVQGCTTIDCAYQRYYKIGIFSSPTNTRPPTEKDRILADPIINLVTGEGAMTVEEDDILKNDANKFNFIEDINEFAASTGMRIGEDGLIENPFNVQPPATASRGESTIQIDLSPVKEAVVVKKLCENDCNNHGICQYGKCVCYPGYLPSTCLYRSCPYGTSLSNPSNEYEKDDRVVYECSNQGKCNRDSGLCECFAGYEGNACQRKTCPNQCSGHGVCETIGNVEMMENNDMIINNDRDYLKWDKEHMQVCVCDKEYTGYDCSQKKCPYGYIQGNDCEAGEFTTITLEITNTVSDIKTDCKQDNQYVHLKYTDLWGRDWYTEKFDVGCKSGWENAIGKLPPGVISLDANYGIEINQDTNTKKITVTIMFSKHQTGRQNIIKILTLEDVEAIPEIKNGGTFHTITNTDGLLEKTTVTPTIDLVSPAEECSNAGICDRGTGLCKCFEGYIGVSCNQASSVL